MFMRRVGHALLLGALIVLSLPAWADSSVRIVRLSYVDGHVQVNRGAGDGLERAILNLPVTSGMQLATGDDGSAEVEFEDGSTLRLVPNSTVDFTQLSLRDDGRRLSTIALRNGTAYLEASNKKDDFTITLDGQQITIARPARVRIARSDAGAKVAVFKGDVDVRGAGDPVRVKKDETFTLDLNDPSRYLLAKGVEPDSYDTWSQERDQYRETYAANHHDSYNSSYNYGWSDMNYFGNFSQFGSYGTLWRPYGVGSGWDPFADGAWVWYPGAGYMWVSAYPWGWMPYRYGQWIYVPGYGWCWRPTRYWNTWSAVPVIYGAPRGYVAPTPPVMVKTVPGPVPRTVPVGRGPMNDVRDARYDRWMQDRQVGAPASKTVPVKPLATQPVPSAVPATAAQPASTPPATVVAPASPRTAAPVRTNRRLDTSDQEVSLPKGPGTKAKTTTTAPPANIPAATPPPPPPPPPPASIRQSTPPPPPAPKPARTSSPPNPPNATVEHK